MKHTPKTYLHRFAQQWQALRYAEAGAYALGAALLVGLALGSPLWGLAVAALVGAVAVVILRPWHCTAERSATYVDAHLAEVHHSSALLLQPVEQLPALARLQQYRTGQVLLEKGKELRPPHGLKRALPLMLLMALLGGFLAQRGVLAPWGGARGTEGPSIQFAPVSDRSDERAVVPELVAQEITLTYPNYTKMAPWQGSEPNIKAVEGTRIRWQLAFDAPVQQVVWESMGEERPLETSGEGYGLSLSLEASRFYSFRFVDGNGESHVTELYALEAVPDTEPTITMGDAPQYVYFEHTDVKEITVNANILDDFGTATAHIIATVSKGSGESVKFREERLSFDTGFVPGSTKLSLQKTMDLDALKMAVGDELYYYVEAVDHRQPRPNIARSETYFAIIKDTVTDTFAVEGAMGVDLMPDYFRSQRQLIIDTEKLLKDKPALSETEFKSRSNELGFDQKSLRLKYGQFMGDESEMALDTETTEAPGEDHDHDHDHEDGEEDPLAAYTHDHDGDNEHNLVPQEEEKEDPLHDYIHNHSDPEEATLFEESLKSKLRKALNIMWDAELHLRLYDPKKSLPYQYDALQLIQEIKNSARIYVHRIGFDPPPIKEDKRLTGDITTVDNVQKTSEQMYEPTYPNMRRAVARLEVLAQNPSGYGPTDGAVLTAAGNELARLAVAEPGTHLQLLQQVKGLEQAAARTPSNYRNVQKGLMALLPPTEATPRARQQVQDKVQQLFLNALREYD